MAIQRVNFTSIPVADQDRALSFYRDNLGFDVQLDAPYAVDWRWIFMALPNSRTRLHFARQSELRWQDGMPALALVSDNVDDDAARFRDAGVEITHGPEDTPWAEGARYLMIRDSEGNIVFMESLKGD